jgi:hypothetical protein
MPVLIEPAGVAGESFVIDGLEMGESGEEEAKEVEVEYFLAVVSGESADGELFYGGGEGVVGEGGVAEAIAVADEGAQLEALEVEGMEALRIVT